MLMDAYLEFGVGSKAPLERFKAVERIVKPVSEHAESRLALAEAALNAKLWGEARAQLEALEQIRPSLRVFRLRARLAEEDTGDHTTPEMWLERAATADSDPHWVCGDCGTVADDWTAVCGHCGAFATLDWNQPPRIHRAVMAPQDGRPNETPPTAIAPT
jgi:HemY protein